MGKRSVIAWSGALVLLLGVAQGSAAAQETDLNFRRADANADGIVDLSDGVRILLALFTGRVGISCRDAADTDDNGRLEVTDATAIFEFLFREGAAPTAPYRVCGADPTPDDLGCEAFDLCPQGPSTPTAREDVVHLLNRAGYGPNRDTIDYVEAIGIAEYIEEQLSPASIDESDNTVLRTRENALFTERLPAKDTVLLPAGSVWHYRKGTSEPPATWKNPGFVPTEPEWQIGVTGIGYGDGDDVTILNDMRGNYLSVYMTTTFEVPDVSAVDRLVLRVNYDDGFAAYLNGTMIVREGISGNPPRYNQTAASHDATGAEDFDVTARKSLLVDGTNTLAIQVHNRDLDSSDLSMIPELVSREILPGDPVRVIKGIDELQQLLHVRGIYSRKQLQAVLGEFWENHFTTDYDKLVEYFGELKNSDANDAMGEAQARAEAAQVEYLEYEFFYENALGNFGDLLLYSATSPSMLVYLDNVLNFKREPNENYSREAYELFAFGVDNRYTQRDIEVLARAFTGWFVCKVDPENALAFPDSARNPPATCGVQFRDTEIVGLGSGWKYFKGTREPTPDATGAPTTAWTQVDYDDSGWLNGATGIGYGDGDDRTVLNDMRNNYVSVYLRREFTLDDPMSVENLIFTAIYDDGIVVYVNGQEIGRSESMDDADGQIPAYDFTSEAHERDEDSFDKNLNGFRRLLNPAPAKNVLAIQVHNTNIGSSDLSILPRLLDREILPGSVENGDPNAVWTFRFEASEHDTGSKVLHQGTPWQISIPSRTGAAGVNDAIQVLDAMANHPSTKEFICIKLIQRFVSDQITLNAFKHSPQSVPIELRELLADSIDAWSDTGGSIDAVMRVILDPQNRESAFWSDLARRSKVKTPIEVVNSSIRVLDGLATGADLPEITDEIGMHFFTRDDPDGWSENGAAFASTNSFLEAFNFQHKLATNAEAAYRFNARQFVSGLSTADDIVDDLISIMFPGAVPEANRQILIDYVSTSTSGTPLPLSSTRSDFTSRVEELVALMLSMPQWRFQ